MKPCLVCEKGELMKVQDIIIEVEGYAFVVKGQRCAQCREEFLDEGETQKVIDATRKLGVWLEPLKLYRRLSRNSGGLVLRIPADLEKQLKLNEKTEIAISKVGNKIVIEAEE